MISSAANDAVSGNEPGTGPAAETQTATNATNTENAPEADPAKVEDGGSRIEDGGQAPDAEFQTASAPAADHRFLDVPDLIPARMLNEFAYCPRLAYLEWAQGEFVHNLDTLEGRFGHRRVDEPSRGNSSWARSRTAARCCDGICPRGTRPCWGNWPCWPSRRGGRRAWRRCWELREWRRNCISPVSQSS